MARPCLPLLALLVALLSACAGRQDAPDVADGAPLKSIRPSQVADAVPRADPILSAGNKSPYTVRPHWHGLLRLHREFAWKNVSDSRKEKEGCVLRSIE